MIDLATLPPLSVGERRGYELQLRHLAILRAALLRLRAAISTANPPELTKALRQADSALHGGGGEGYLADVTLGQLIRTMPPASGLLYAPGVGWRLYIHTGTRWEAASDAGELADLLLAFLAERDMLGLAAEDDDPPDDAEPAS